MKKIYSYALAIGVSIMTLAACSDFLEVQPRTQVSETEFYKTEDVDDEGTVQRDVGGQDKAS